MWLKPRYCFYCPILTLSQVLSLGYSKFWLFITSAIKNRCHVSNCLIKLFIKNKQQRRSLNSTSLTVHIKNFLNYWYGNCSPSNFTALSYILDMEEKGILHIKSNIVPMICACITLLTSEFGSSFLSMVLFKECNVCRLFDVQYFSEWIQVSECIICTMPWCATVCLASGRIRILSLTVRLQRASFDVNGTILLHQYCPTESS